LSQSSQQGLDKLILANLSTFDAAGHQLQVRQQGRIHHACCVQAHPLQKQPSAAWWCRRCGIIRWGKISKTGELAAPMGRPLTTAALAVASFFVLSSLGGLIVLGTASVRALPSMLFPAAERAV
jgi:hypothetical protein